MARMLLVEDDEFISRVLAYFLEEKGHSVACAGTAGEALGLARDEYDVILLDILLPDADGVELCRRLRQWHSCPIIFFSSMDDSETIIRALDAGGDDFLPKPFDNNVLLAHIEANLRRARNEFAEVVPTVMEGGDLRLDVRARQLTQQVREPYQVRLPPMECRLLAFLMEHPGQFFSSEELYRRVWGKDSYGDVRTVLVHIRHLRMKIEEDPNNPTRLRNIWGKGYGFFPPQDPEEDAGAAGVGAVHVGHED